MLSRDPIISLLLPSILLSLLCLLVCETRAESDQPISPVGLIVKSVDGILQTVLGAVGKLTKGDNPGNNTYY